MNARSRARAYTLVGSCVGATRRSGALPPAGCGARRSLDSAEDPSPDAESSEPSGATELGVSPVEDDETELDDASPVFDHEAAPDVLVAETAAPALMTTDEATEALDILHNLRPRLPTGKTLAAEVDRLELDLQRAILIQTTLASASGGVRRRSGLGRDGRRGEGECGGAARVLRGPRFDTGVRGGSRGGVSGRRGGGGRGGAGSWLRRRWWWQRRQRRRPGVCAWAPPAPSSDASATRHT